MSSATDTMAVAEITASLCCMFPPLSRLQFLTKNSWGSTWAGSNVRIALAIRLRFAVIFHLPHPVPQVDGFGNFGFVRAFYRAGVNSEAQDLGLLGLNYRG